MYLRELLEETQSEIIMGIVGFWLFIYYGIIQIFYYDLFTSALFFFVAFLCLNKVLQFDEDDKNLLEWV